MERLAVYGSLKPGEVNHAVVASIPGTWSEGWVLGFLLDRGWGAGEGYPAIRLSDEGERVPVSVLESDELAEHWERLDAFEGEEYRRIVATVHHASGETRGAYIYALNEHESEPLRSRSR